MPWPEKQRRAIFLDIKRRKGEAAARRFMREHGYGGGDVIERQIKKRGKR
jgi:hypothetical protein